jgi:glycosyltransferase involved in cell wall biosynthesis
VAGSAAIATSGAASPVAPPDIVEISIVMPCLNEADTLAVCITKALAAIEKHGISAEIIVADNGSTDGSQQIAESLGARVVPVTMRGYGSALMGGIEAARGRFILMGDADDSYDFGELPRFLEKLREGYDLVQGCRLPAGGGTVLPGAMPGLHRWWGNPMFSSLARYWFKVRINDVNCGLRGFTREFYTGLRQRCIGMEFANEMIIKGSLYGARIAEVPITLYPDGRVAHPPHLRTFRDGWRTLRFYLLYSPRWLFLIPGLALIVLGLAGYAIGLPGVRFRGIHFDVHTLLFASLSVICGYQSILFAVFTKVFAISEDLLPPDPVLTRAFRVIKLETGLATGAGAMVVGVYLLFDALASWRATGFGDLQYAVTMRWVIPGVTLVALGFETILASFFLSLLGMRRR